MKRCYHHVTDPLTMRLILRNLPHRGAAVVENLGGDAYLLHKACANDPEVAEGFLAYIFEQPGAYYHVTEHTMFERKQYEAQAACSICKQPLRNTSGYDDKEDPALEALR